MESAEVRACCDVEPVAEKLLKAVMRQLNLSVRTFHHLLKLVQTIADLSYNEVVAANHVAKAIQYRPHMGL